MHRGRRCPTSIRCTAVHVAKLQSGVRRWCIGALVHSSWCIGAWMQCCNAASASTSLPVWHRQWGTVVAARQRVLWQCGCCRSVVPPSFSTVSTLRTQSTADGLGSACKHRPNTRPGRAVLHRKHGRCCMSWSTNSYRRLASHLLSIRCMDLSSLLYQGASFPDAVCDELPGKWGSAQQVVTVRVLSLCL